MPCRIVSFLFCMANLLLFFITLFYFLTKTQSHEKIFIFNHGSYGFIAHDG
jgi:hypothetical protein